MTQMPRNVQWLVRLSDKWLTDKMADRSESAEPKPKFVMLKKV